MQLSGPIHGQTLAESCNGYTDVRILVTAIPTLFFRATDAPFSISSKTMFSLSSSQAIISGEWQRYLSGMSIAYMKKIIHSTNRYFGRMSHNYYNAPKNNF